MAEKKNEIQVPDTLKFRYKAQFSTDWDAHRLYIQKFDAWEAMLMGEVYDTVTRSIDGTKITDSYATTLAKERADRVMAKLPDGNTEAVGSSDVGKAAFMDILRQKWIYPNANAQHRFFEKLNMWQFYSSVYGYMPMFVDWNISPSGYAGPDCWLWNPRLVVPQTGRTSIADMEYLYATSYVSKTWLEDLQQSLDEDDYEGDDDTASDPTSVHLSAISKETGWDMEALKLLVANADHLTSWDVEKDTKVARDRTNTPLKRGIELITRYEAGEDGRWVTFAPSCGFVQVRSLKNPHKNGRIPFVVKYSQPLFDSFYGLGDFQRAMPLQFARDGLTNFYFKGIKMNLIPPIVANANGVLEHTLDYREGGVMLETIPNSIRRLETSTAGLATFQAAQDSLTGSLLQLYGSQNASIASGDALNPSQGKTPQAINLYSDKEATRDGSERRHLEDAMEQLQEIFYELVVNVGSEDIPISLFADDIKDIVKSGMADVTDIFDQVQPNDSQTAGMLKINPDKLKGVAYRFHINPDSTAKDNKDTMMKSLVAFIQQVAGMQNLFANDPRLQIHWDKISSSLEELSGIPGASEFITFDPNAKPQPPAPNVNSLPTPNGGVIDAPDLVKLYLGTADVGLQGQLIKTLGYTPTAPAQAPEPTPEPAPEPEPSVISSGHMFRDPHVAQAAEAIQSNYQTPEAKPPEPEPEPNVGPGGRLFKDATLAKAATALHAM